MIQLRVGIYTTIQLNIYFLADASKDINIRRLQYFRLLFFFVEVNRIGIHMASLILLHKVQFIKRMYCFGENELKNVEVQNMYARSEVLLRGIH